MGMAMIDAVELLASVAEAQPESDDEALVETLIERGVEPRTARRLMVFVPMATARVSLAGQGIIFSNTYLVAIDPIKEYPLRKAEEFVVASTAAAQGRLSGSQISALALRSAEIAAIGKAFDDGARPEDLVMGPGVTTWPEAAPDANVKLRWWHRRWPRQ